jgi:hypothetical protein
MRLVSLFALALALTACTPSAPLDASFDASVEGGYSDVPAAPADAAADGG